MIVGLVSWNSPEAPKLSVELAPFSHVISLLQVAAQVVETSKVALVFWPTGIERLLLVTCGRTDMSPGIR